MMAEAPTQPDQRLVILFGAPGMPPPAAAAMKHARSLFVFPPAGVFCIRGSAAQGLYI